MAATVPEVSPLAVVMVGAQRCEPIVLVVVAGVRGGRPLVVGAVLVVVVVVVVGCGSSCTKRITALGGGRQASDYAVHHIACGGW